MQCRLPERDPRVSAGVPPSAGHQPKPPVERQMRRPVHMNGYAILPDGSTSHITLKDLSYDGCGIAIATSLEPGDTIRLSVLGRSAIAAEVRWCERGKAGLVFEPAPVTEATVAEQQERMAERIRLRADVTLRRAGRRNFEVILNDLSPAGCKVEFVDRPEVEERVWLRFDGLDRIAARICWVEGYGAGLSFDKPIHPAVFDLLLERIRVQ